MNFIKEIKEVFSENNIELVTRIVKGEELEKVLTEMVEDGKYDSEEETKIQFSNGGENGDQIQNEQLLLFNK